MKKSMQKKTRQERKEEMLQLFIMDRRCKIQTDNMTEMASAKKSNNTKKKNGMHNLVNRYNGYIK